jgi:hypothetical protein
MIEKSGRVAVANYPFGVADKGLGLDFVQQSGGPMPPTGQEYGTDFRVVQCFLEVTRSEFVGTGPLMKAIVKVPPWEDTVASVLHPGNPFVDFLWSNGPRRRNKGNLIARLQPGRKQYRGQG